VQSRDCLHVLLAEDNAFNRELTCAVLAGQGHRVTTAEDGEGAVALFREQTFDLILMDVAMPRMDGREATRAIRGIERAAGGHVPIIALTAHDSPEERQACLDAGMDDLLAKPVSGDSLAESIARCGRKTRGVDLSGESGSKLTETGNGPTDRPVVAAPLAAVLSDAVLAEFNATPERLKRYFDLLREDLRTQIEAMNAAYETGDSAALRDAAHAAKGVAGSLRDQSLSRLAGEIEGRARSGERAGVRERLSEFMRLHLMLTG
jgi:CheY-like chemotaxis protein/HPt (histidine-containing phosphotransfer) domain-containing protein